MSHIINPFRFGGGDADVAAFIAATGIADGSIESALEDLVASLKTASIWTKFYALYPFVGGTASTHKYNLKDPQDTDGAYRLTFNGTFTHNANGITPGGTSSDYADTHLNGSTVLSKTDSHWSFYSRSDLNILGADYGDNSSAEILTRFSGTFYHDLPRESDRFTVTQADTLGFFNGCLGASDVVVYQNGTSIASKGSAAASNYSNTTMVFCAGYTSYGRASSRNLAFGSIGTALTGGEASDFYDAVQTFQTALSRNV